MSPLIRAVLPLVFGLSTVPASAQTPAETPIEARGPQGSLAGTLIAPSPGKPVVLMLPGSGPTDRDGNNPLGVRAGSTRLLAQALAAQGIGSVRVDKRGMFGSKAAIPDANAVTIVDYAADVHQWVDVIRARTGARCVWLLGHSEGGLIALKAAQAPEGICGLVLLAAAGRPMGTLLREQLAASGLPAKMLAQADAGIARLEKGERVDAATMPPVLLPLFAPAVQGFLIDQMALDPARLASAYRGPVLIVSGTRDVQVVAADAEALHRARPDAPLLMVPGMTHVLKRAESEGRAASLPTYGDPALPLAPGLAEGIATFLLAHSAR